MSESGQRWSEQFKQERARLLSTLGEVWEGGVVESLEHIGSTSVPGLLASPCIDIGLAVWPLPLEPQPQAALEALGYQAFDLDEHSTEQRFRHSTGAFQLCLVEAGSERWMEYTLVRDYLRHHVEARQAFSAFKQSSDPKSADTLAAKAQQFLQILQAARPWWVNQQGFTPVTSVAHELNAFRFPWYISSGWALDLFLGRVTRVHHDVDVVLPRSAQLALQTYLTGRGWKLVTPVRGRLEPWPTGLALALPRHQVHAHRDGAFIDLLLSEIDSGVWRYRRAPAIVRAAERMSLSTSGGLPFLAPELVLLFKSKSTSGKERIKDQADFERVVPHLEPERRAWLCWALLATEPEHPWIEQLASGIKRRTE